MRFLVLLAYLLMVWPVALNAEPIQNWVVMSSGDGTTVNESWSVDVATVRKLPRFNPLRSNPPLGPREAALIALAHLTKRYPTDSFQIAAISLERFIPQQQLTSETDARDWVYIVSYTYNQKGSAQQVAVLLNGDPVLSNIELSD